MHTSTPKIQHGHKTASSPPPTSRPCICQRKLIFCCCDCLFSCFLIPSAAPALVDFYLLWHLYFIFVFGFFMRAFSIRQKADGSKKRRVYGKTRCKESKTGWFVASGAVDCINYKQIFSFSPCCCRKRKFCCRAKHRVFPQEVLRVRASGWQFIDESRVRTSFLWCFEVGRGFLLKINCLFCCCSAVWLEKWCFYAVFAVI